MVAILVVVSPMHSQQNDKGSEQAKQVCSRGCKVPGIRPTLESCASSCLRSSEEQQTRFHHRSRGTEIRVDIVDGKGIVPARVGFATPIPALSRAAVTVNRKYYAAYNVSYDASGNYPDTFTENAELTSVTVGAVAYGESRDSAFK